MKYDIACGIDEVYNNYFKWALEWIGPVLVNLFNAALMLEMTPDAWSQQMLVPILKRFR